MAIERESALRKAEKLLRQGKLDAAIAEYQLVIDDQPRDWNTANALGDLFVRAGQVDKAVAQYTRVADHLGHEGFFSKASALYKKILKIKPDDEHSLLKAAEISTRQGLLADAKSYLTVVAERRRTRGDQRGAAEIRVRLGKLDPADLDARMGGARAAAEIGAVEDAARQMKEVAAELTERGKDTEAFEALQEAARLDPADDDTRRSLVRSCLARGDFEGVRSFATSAEQFREIATDLRAAGQEDHAIAALVEAVRLDPEATDTRRQLARLYLSRGDLERTREFLTRDVAGDDPGLMLTLAELELRAGAVEPGIDLLQSVLAMEPERRERVVLLAWGLCDSHPDAAFQCIDMAATASIAVDDWAAAAAAFHEFVTRVPSHIPALMRLVEICVDGGLEATMYTAQAQLADAYLAAGSGVEARVIAEDLVAREPWERSNVERFRRALEMLGEPDPDVIIADRLSGQSPFTSTDLFLDAEEMPPVSDVLPEAAGRDAPHQSAPAARTRSGEMPPAPHSEQPGRRSAAGHAPGDGSFELGPNAIDLSSILANDRDEAERRTPHAEAPASVEVDLSHALYDLKESADAPSGGPMEDSPRRPRDLDGVFEDFREEVSRQTSSDVAAQHYKLALTYREMGMMDEAIQALEMAARSPRHRFDAASMLARTYLERGKPVRAIEWFERAAEAPAATVEAGRALLYELGSTLESIEEHARALAVYLELQADAGEYRDLPRRIERLSKIQPKR